MKEGVLSRIPNGNGEIRISFEKFKGKDYVDIRKYYFDPPGTDLAADSRIAPEHYFKPTKKGILLSPAKFKKVVAALIPLSEEMPDVAEEEGE